MKLTTEQFLSLENFYLTNFPDDIPSEILQDYKAIIKYKQLLRNTRPNRRVLNCILDIVLQKIENSKGFQKKLFIGLIRKQSDSSIFDEKTSSKLFRVFQLLIIDLDTDIAWRLSASLKEIKLSTENIDWLIENFERSEHIQNRLLRYSTPNEMITEWAKDCLKKRKLKNRLSELIGLALNFDKTFSHKNTSALLWGIHYSKLEEQTKRELLIKNLTADNFTELLKICEKNNYTEIISEIYNEFGRI